MNNKISAAFAALMVVVAVVMLLVVLFVIVIPSLGLNPFVTALGISLMAMEVALAALGVLLFILALRLVKADAEADDSRE